MCFPVTVSGATAQGPFSEKTQTIVINAHGALVALESKVTKGQAVTLKSATFPEDQECRVIWIGPTAGGKTQAGLEFTRSVPKFWGVSFPPPD